MTVYFYNFAKRINSTKRMTRKDEPYIVAHGGIYYTDSISVTTPTIIFERERNPWLEIPENQNVVFPDSCMYAAILWPRSADEIDIIAPYPYDVRLYYLTDIQYLSDGRLVVSFTEDILGTFRNHIMKSVQMVERTNVYPDTDGYAEQVMPVKSQPKLVKQYLDSPFSQGGGYYIIGCVAEEVGPTNSWNSMFESYGVNVDNIDVNDCILLQSVPKVGETPEQIGTPTSEFTEVDTSTTVRGGVRYYTFSAIEARNFIQALGKLQGAFADFDIAKYFVSCTYIPFENVPTSQVSQVNTCFHFGDDKNNQMFVFMKQRTEILEAYAPGGVYTVDVQKIGIMRHPSYSDRPTAGKVTTSYINYEPYLDCSLVYGPFGTLDIPLNVVANKIGVDFHIVIEIDLCDGLGNLRLVQTPINVSPLSTSTADINNIITITSVKQKISASIPLVSLTSDSYSKHLGYETQYTKGKLKHGSWPSTRTQDGTAELSLALIGNIIANIPATASAVAPIGTKSPARAASNVISSGVDNGIAIFENEANHTLAQYNNSVPTIYQTPSNGSFLGFNETLDYCLMYTVLEIDNVQPDFYNSLIGKPIHKAIMLETVYNTAITNGLNYAYVKCTGAALVSYSRSTTIGNFTVWNTNTVTDLANLRVASAELKQLVINVPLGFWEPNVTADEYKAIVDALNNGIYLE